MLRSNMSPWQTQKFVDFGCALFYCVEDPFTMRLRADWSRVLEWCLSMQWYDIRDMFFETSMVSRMGSGEPGKILNEHGEVRGEFLTDSGAAFCLMARIAKEREANS